MQLLNRLEILSKTKEIELCWIPSHIEIKGNDQADSAAKTAWKMPYTDLHGAFNKFPNFLYRHLKLS